MILNLLVFVALSGPMQRAAAAPAPQPALSVCEVKQHPDRYVGKRITVRAFVMNALPHGIFLSEGWRDRCIIFAGDDAPGHDNEVLGLAVNSTTPAYVKVTGVLKRAKHWSDVMQRNNDILELDQMIVERAR